jgi:phosphohistidine phosphatase
MRRLYVLRHAKSDWTVGARDHARPLNGRGVRSAEAIGRVLGQAGEKPAKIVSSTATRARSTAELVMDAAGWDLPLVLSDDLYLTSVAGTLDVVAAEGGELDSLMIVGHEPTWSNVIEYLTGGIVEVKTATVVALDTHGGWTTLRERSCSLGFILHPRLFMG